MYYKIKVLKLLPICYVWEDDNFYIDSKIYEHYDTPV